MSTIRKRSPQQGRLYRAIAFFSRLQLHYLQALLFNRLLGGPPYALWRFNPQVPKNYAILAGIPQSGTTFWQQLVTRTFQRR